MELKLYREEKISVKDIPYPDNSDTLALLEKKNGVFVLLRDTLKIKTGTDAAFATKLQSAQRRHASASTASATPRFETGSRAGFRVW